MAVPAAGRSVSSGDNTVPAGASDGVGPCAGSTVPDVTCATVPFCSSAAKLKSRPCASNSRRYPGYCGFGFRKPGSR